jgi:cytochrome c oxidase subunit IV
VAHGGTEEALRRTEAQSRPAAVSHEPELVHHPEPKQYVVVAVALAVATLIEIGLYYVPGFPRGVVIGLLLGLAVFKFAMVALWFMHLRFDNALFRRLFTMGLALAITVYMVVLVIMGALTAPGLLLVMGILAAAGTVVYLRSRRAEAGYEARFAGPTPGRPRE